MTEFFNLLVSFLALTVLEIVLGIDNLVFLAIISQRVENHLQKKARQLGLLMAWVTRLLLLGSAVWLTKLTYPIVTLFDFSFSGRDIFLIAGGMFLVAKSTQEIHTELETNNEADSIRPIKSGFYWVVTQIALLDIIFSLDSVLTAIGLTPHFWLMALAITIAIIVMIFSSEPISRFIHKHPTIKMLALSFLILIGTVLIADGFHFHIPREYIYFAMGFSVFVESLNLVRRKKRIKAKKTKSTKDKS
ncbi:MAG: TerC family protein [Gammaproteobacteria bacterium]|nr:TerC family protein [Gammaproteobacteria bacterium]